MIAIRPATREDCEALAAMIGALLSQHHTAVPDGLASAQRRDGFGAAPRRRQGLSQEHQRIHIVRLQ